MPEVIFVKNMVCHRCVLAMEDVLKRLSISFNKVVIGEVHLPEKLTPVQTQQLGSQLSSIGLELIDNRANSMIEKIKMLVIKKARNETDQQAKKLKLSTYLSQHLHHEYTYLSALFSSVEGRTIEHYFIEQRIEKVKELIVYNEMSLTAISYELDYSSVAHLSNQFKKITGLTPSYFRKVGSDRRKKLDDI
jgi:AraC family transcriptional regulator